MNDGRRRLPSQTAAGTTGTVVSVVVSPESGSWRFTSYLSPATLVGHEVRMA